MLYCWFNPLFFINSFVHRNGSGQIPASRRSVSPHCSKPFQRPIMINNSIFTWANIVLPNDEPLEKSQKLEYVTSELPIAYSGNGHPSPTRRTSDNLSSLSWLRPMRRKSAAIQTELRSNTQRRNCSASQKRFSISLYPQRQYTDHRNIFGSRRKIRSPPRHGKFGPPTGPLEYMDRPSTGVSLSYYAIDPSNLSVYADNTRAFNADENMPYLSNEESQRENLDASAQPSSLQLISASNSQVGERNFDRRDHTSTN